MERGREIGMSASESTLLQGFVIPLADVHVTRYNSNNHSGYPSSLQLMNTKNYDHATKFTYIMLWLTMLTVASFLPGNKTSTISTVCIFSEFPH